MTDRSEFAASSPRPAALWRRLAGLLYDLIAVLAIVMVVGLVCQLATRGQLVHTGSHTAIAWWYRPLQYLVVSAYFVVSWQRGGQTLGMRPWRMRLYRHDGCPARAPATLIRAGVVSLPLLLLSIGNLLPPADAMLAALAAWTVLYGTCLFDRRHRALHDILAGTELRYSPRKPRVRHTS